MYWKVSLREISRKRKVNGMNLKNKKTVLGDNAALYNQRGDISEKEKWETMNKKERLRYFADYYLLKIIVAVAVVGLLVSFIATALRPVPERIFSIAVVEDAGNQALYEELRTKLEELLVLDAENEEIIVDTSHLLSTGDYQAWQKYFLYNTVGDIDISLMPNYVFEEYAPGNYFSPIFEYLSSDLYVALEPYFLESPLRDQNGTIIPDSEAVYGINISSTWLYENVQSEEQMILVINIAPKNVDNIEKFLTFLFFSE